MDERPLNPHKTMESPAQFDLNAAIAQWRGSLAQSPEYSAADLDELESHLRDSVESLARSGMTLESAFAAASARFGQPDAIAREFGKAHPERGLASRLIWLVIGLVLLRVPGAVAGTLENAFEMAAYYFGPHTPRSPLGTFPLASQALVTVIVLCVYYRFLCRKFDVLERLAQWAIDRPRRFIGFLVAASVCLFALPSLSSACVHHFVPIMSFFPDDWNLKMRVLVDQLLITLLSFGVGLAPLVAQIRSRPLAPEVARRRTLHVAWISAAWIVSSLAKFALYFSQNCITPIEWAVLNGHVNSKSLLTTGMILTALALDVLILFRTYRFARNDSALFGRFEIFATERPKRLLVEMLAIASAGGVLLEFFEFLLEQVMPNEYFRDLSFAYSTIALVWLSNLSILGFMLWLAFKACRLGREIQQNVPRGTN